MTAASGPRTRVALVTGALGGIGGAVTRALLDQGLGVVVTDLDGDACRAAAEGFKHGSTTGTAVGHPLDVTDPDSWQRVTRFARRRFGHLDVLVNNAGTLGIHGLESCTPQEWDRVVDTCQRGTWLGMRAVTPCMRSAGGGSIVNVSSIYGLVGSGAAFAYHAAKGAVRAMTRAAAVELAPAGIRVNAVSPGMVSTAMTAAVPQEFMSEVIARTPLRRAAHPDEVAAAVRFLACGTASFVTGTELVVDGGFTAL
ncbi:Cyclopentanol dehydrogenase [Streptomyces hundungensis]|uniref:Cyclopentanol dehydrogenase n=1 Tax=Streptomyces hundungensis TaxID=1077946 RepID=A0A387H606_9ACTN|nr:glucose 1-dehydrogenase [Streptomyces hundungensis]AYG78689.1 Cyclopentanol dehydrogenase [Streptomyces hundungensis]